MPGRVLLLQGPVGSFFSLLARELRAEGHEVFKIHFNGGDEALYREPGVRFQGTLAQWPAMLKRFLVEHEIDRIFLFGDCRSYHVAARQVARELEIPVFVFEEGYLRPDFITLEPDGVNGHSAIPRDPEFYWRIELKPLPKKEPAAAGFWPVARQAVRYYLAACLYSSRYPSYFHHRPVDLLGEAGRWVRAGLRKLRYVRSDRATVNRLCRTAHKQLFVIPLQVHCDAQVTHHSVYDGVGDFIEEVMSSFAVHAPADARLVFKHHPLDRAYCNYRPAIEELAEMHGVADRVSYLVDGHLPTLLESAKGVVVINSTVGLSAIHHRVPVKVLGDAIYDMPGLTSTAHLDEFWTAPGEVDRELYRRFRYHLVTEVLGNGSFYRRSSAGAGHTGVAWPSGSLTAACDPARSRFNPPAELPQASNNVIEFPRRHPAARPAEPAPAASPRQSVSRPGFAVSLMPRRRVVQATVEETVEMITALRRHDSESESGQ